MESKKNLMENKILNGNGEECMFTLEEIRAALSFEELMEQQGYTYNPYGECVSCEAMALCDCVSSILLEVDKRDQNSAFYCGLASEMRTGTRYGHYEFKSKKTTDGGAVQSSDGTDGVPVEPHGDVY